MPTETAIDAALVRQIVAETLAQAEPRPLAVRAVKAARLLDVSPRTVWTLASTGKLHPVKLGGTTLFRLAELEGLLSEGGER